MGKFIVEFMQKLTFAVDPADAFLLALLSAGVSLLTFTVVMTTTTTVLFGLITRTTTLETTPYQALGFFILGLVCLIGGWRHFIA